MSDIKTDSEDHKLCRGCLSSDRKVFSVAAGHFYYSLLTEEQKGEALANTHTNLCWECVALLRRMQLFQGQVRRAHTVLENCLGLSPSKPTLSSLTVCCKFEYDDIIEEDEDLLTGTKQEADENVDKILIPSKYKSQFIGQEIKSPKEDEDSNFVEITCYQSDDFEYEYHSDFSDDYNYSNDKEMTSRLPEITAKRVNTEQTVQKGKKRKRATQNDVILKEEVTEPQCNLNNDRKIVQKIKSESGSIVKTPLLTKLEIELQKFMQNTKNDAFKMQQVTDTQNESNNKMNNKEPKKDIDIHAKESSKNSIEADNGDVETKEIKATQSTDPDFILDEDAVSSESDTDHGPKRSKTKDDDKKEPQTKRKFNKIIKPNYYKDVEEVLSCFTEIEMSWSDLKRTLDYEDAIVDPNKPHKCSICGVNFKNCGFRKRHAMRIHKPKYPDCFKKGSFQNPPLSIPEKPCLWHCNICNRMLRWEHLVAHVNELHRTQYFCNGDGCKWTQKCFWTREDHVHHWENIHKKFTCDVCGENKNSRAMIVKHMRKHFKPPKPPTAPLPCPHCDRTFNKRGSLYSHVRARHTDTPIEGRYCVECDMTFISVHTFRNHVAIKHTESQKAYDYFKY